MIRLAVAYVRTTPTQAVERAHALGIGGTVLWVDLETGPESLRPAFARARDLGIAVYGLNAYANLIHPDLETRRLHVDSARAALEFAVENGLPWANMMAGTRETTLSFWAYHPDNYNEAAWADLLASVCSLLDTTPESVMLTLEPYMMTPLATAQRLRRVIDDVGSRRLGIILDPVNLIGPGEYHDSARVVESMVATVADRLIGVHAKDHFMHRQKATVQIDERVPGEGDFPYDALLRALDRVPGEPKLIIEHLHDDAQVAAARDHIRRTAADVGVALA